MIEGRPSDTAMQVAAARAAHLRFDPPPHILEDRVAEVLLDDAGRAMIDGYGDDGPWILQENRIFLPLRARFVEDRVAEAYARGVRQLVILGAGLDSFAWRRPEALEGLRVYEVDHPSTQAWKRERLATVGLDVPSNTRLVPCDFEREPASAALARTDFDRERPAVVSWMGVVYYLARETADAAMADLAGLLAPKSVVCLDAMLPWDALPERYQALRKAMADYLSGAGEPQVNRYTPEALIAALEGAGFASATIADRDALRARYLAPGGVEIPLAERFLLAEARR